MNKIIQKITFKPAFSLVEMLMALLVASLLLAALAPVITRKMNENIHISGTGELYKAPADMQCFSYSDSQPEVDVSINDVYSVSFLISSAGGGGAGATSSKKIAQTPVQITGASANDTTREVIITEYMTDVKATLAGAGGGGAGGAGYVSACPTGTMEFEGNSSTKAFCMTKYNVGERENIAQSLNKAYVPARNGGLMFYANDTSASNYCGSGKANSGQCCYRAKGTTTSEAYTADPRYCVNVGDYYTCTRTVCQFNVAINSCNNFAYAPANVPVVNWTLASAQQFEMLKPYAASSSSVERWKLGASLCSDHTGSVDGFWYGAPTDKDRYATGVVSYQRCYGSVEGRCYPSHLYSSTLTAGGLSNWYYIGGTASSSGSLAVLGGPSANYNLHAFSARCTLDKSNLFKSYSGAGGAAGAYISELDLTQYVKKAGVNGKIIITAGKAGAGGSAAASNNTKASSGTAGNPSQIIIKKQTGETVYGIRVKGGNGGSAAENITVTGTAAANPNISTSRNCEYTTDGINWNETSCTKNILKGGNGEIKWKESAVKGSASISPVTSNTSGNGAGGEGGTSSYGYNDKISAENGANGKAGIVKITYNNEYAAASGGGGGGGTVAQIKDVQLGRQSECKLIMGKGGKGGSIDNNGTDGGSSSIKCTTDTRTFIVPGGKGGKIGTAASSASGTTAIPTPGKGGGYGDTTKASTTAIKDYNSSKKTINEGRDGEDGIYNQTAKQSIGGRGGTSGTGTKGACGGLYVEDDETKGICLVSETDNKRAEGKGFTYEETITPNSNTLSSSLGTSGAGGGGGGWTRELGSAKGGDGMNGYVCVYWYNSD